MRRLFVFSIITALTLFASACVSTKPIVMRIEKIPEQKARVELIKPFLQNLSDFGNTMAALMLKDYRFHGLKETGQGAYLYRFDTADRKLPKHAYLVFRLEGHPSLTTNVGEKNNILLDGGSFCLVPADDPAVIAGGAFKLQFTRTAFREAFNPYCIGERGTYPTQLLIWFKNPATKDEGMKQITTLLLSAFPQIAYRAN